MEDLSKFEGYLIYDENGAPIGLRKEAPQSLKIEFRKWYIDYQDRERLASLFENQY